MPATDLAPLAGAASIPWAGTNAATRLCSGGPLRCASKHQGAMPAAGEGGGGGGLRVSGGGGGGALRRRWRPCRVGRNRGARRRRPEVVPPGRSWGGGGKSMPPQPGWNGRSLVKCKDFGGLRFRPQCRRRADARRPVGGRAPAESPGARGQEGLEGWANPTKRGGQYRRSCAPFLEDKHLAARRDPG